MAIIFALMVLLNTLLVTTITNLYGYSQKLKPNNPAECYIKYCLTIYDCSLISISSKITISSGLI